jgi:lipopolysaccharide biosynthesis regulator YciM
MNLSDDIRAAFAQAQQHLAAGRFPEAERIYQSMTTAGEQRPLALEALADLYMQQQRWDECIKSWRTLVQDNPDNFQYTARLAHTLDSLGNTQLAIDIYLQFLEKSPAAVAYFNVAQLHKKLKQNDAVVAAYENAIRLGIDQVEEVYLNLGVFFSEMRDGAKAKEMYEKALATAPDYIPALFNLAGLYEETGESEQALDLYNRTLEIQPDYWEALARLAYPRKIAAGDDELANRLEQGVKDSAGSPLDQEMLYFALGKACDDRQQFEKAAAAYSAANALGKKRVKPYDRSTTEQAFDQLVDVYDPEWIREMATNSEAQPVFICGMFRSGSTLLEQMLAAHPSITAGGEFDLLPWLIFRNLAPFPQGIRKASAERLQAMADFYQANVSEMFPDAGYVTDKRPDNFVHLGLAKVLFPKAKIIHTTRDLRDNSLSVFFQQFGNDLGYATDLGDTAHYRSQQERLKTHWMTCFGDDIVTVRYEDLVASPESVLRPLLEHLNLDWDDRVLMPADSDSLVKTASIWQVRQGTHTRSAGRWRNYSSLVDDVAELESGESASD